jgi:hypothetical protein
LCYRSALEERGIRGLHLGVLRMLSFPPCLYISFELLMESEFFTDQKCWGYPESKHHNVNYSYRSKKTALNSNNKRPIK